MNQTFTKTLLGVTFAVSLSVANITATKIAAFEIPLYGLAAVPAGFLGIGVAFLCSDLLSELYGRETARNVVNATVGALIVAYVLVYAAVAMPPAPFYERQSAYASVLGGSLTIVLASVLTALVSQNVDVTIFHWIRNRVEIKAARNLGSTVVSQLIDTSVFIALAFVVLPLVVGGTAVPIQQAVSLIVAQYLVKLIVALADTPLFYALSSIHTRT